MRIFTLLIALFFTTIIGAQTVMPFSHKGKWGLVDSKREIVLSPTYDHIGFFEKKHDNIYTIINDNNKYGLIDKKGEVVFSPQFERLNYDYNGAFFWTYDDNYKDLGLRIYSIKERKEIVYADSLKFKEAIGEKTARFILLRTPDFKNNILLNERGEEVLRFNHSIHSITSEFAELDCPLLYVSTSRHNYKLYECDGTPITREDYLKKHEIVEEYFDFIDLAVEMDLSAEDIEDATTVKQRVQNLFPEVEITKANEWPIHSGNTVSVVVKKGNKYGMISAEGGVILPIEYDDVKPLRTNAEFVVVRQYSSQGIYNVLGKEVLPVKFRAISPVYRPKEYTSTMVEIITVSGYRGYAKLSSYYNNIYLPAGVED